MTGERFAAKVGASGYRGVAFHGPSGRWRALVHVGGTRSFGYYRSIDEAARAVDYGRWTLGLPPINFPDDFDETLARRAEWTTRASLGPRGVAEAVAETLRGRELTVAEVFAAVTEMRTTREAVRKMLATLVRQGRIERVRLGGYRAPDDPPRRC